MAENSRSCKLWCITVVAAVLFLVSRSGESNHAAFAFLPIVMFAVLDAYYVAQDKAFRYSHKEFASKLWTGELVTSDLYCTAPLDPDSGMVCQPLGHSQLGSFMGQSQV